MLAHKFQRKVAKSQRKIFTADKRRSTQIYFGSNFKVLSAFICVHLRLIFFSLSHPRVFASLHLCVFALILFSVSCGSKPTDMRTLVPAETLVYLETNDLAAALQPIIDSKPFNEVAKTKPDFSVLKGVQLAVAVTGFETSEENVDDEQVIGRIQPHFVTVADTHAWNFQAVGFAEQKLGSFVAKIYGGEPTLERSDKNGGKYFTWTAQDGRKAYALVIDAVIYFGNDETSIEKCLAVRRNEADSIAKAAKVPPSDPKTLASGHVSTDGIAQIANVVAIKLASEASDEHELQSIIAEILPKLLRNSIIQMSWMAAKTEHGIEDYYSISTPPELTNGFNQAFMAGEDSSTDSFTNNALVAQLPANTESATRYNLKDPQMALRTVLLLAQKQLAPLVESFLPGVMRILFEPYGISDPDLFLGSLGQYQRSRNIITGQLNSENNIPVVVAVRGTDKSTIRSLSTDLKLLKQDTEQGSIVQSIWSTEYDIQVVFDGDLIKLGPKDDLPNVDGVRTGELSDIRTDDLRKLAASRAPIVTFVRDHESARRIADLIAGTRADDTKAVSTSFTETRFTKTGIERRTVSDFGLIGSMIAQLAQD